MRPVEGFIGGVAGLRRRAGRSGAVTGWSPGGSKKVSGGPLHRLAFLRSSFLAMAPALLSTQPGAAGPLPTSGKASFNVQYSIVSRLPLLFPRI